MTQCGLATLAQTHAASPGGELTSGSNPELKTFAQRDLARLQDEMKHLTPLTAGQ